MPKPANALYDAKNGWNPPSRFQQERAWCEVVQKEKHLQGRHEEQSRTLERRHGGPRGHKWPGGATCGTEADAAPHAPWFEDGDIWRGELLKRQPLKAEPAGSRHNAAHGELERMGTMAIVDLKRRTEEELEKRSWAKALANLDTADLADLSSAIGERLEARKDRARFERRGSVSKPKTPPLAPRSHR